MKIKEFTRFLESFADPLLQESYDNCGLTVGDPEDTLEKVLVCLDVNEKVMDEAIQSGCQLIISHHPVIFRGLKKITVQSGTERIIIKAIKNNIALYALHTSLDNIISGINGLLAEKAGLKNITALLPKKDLLRKLVTFCPLAETAKLREALFKAGAGNIGNYDSCSFNAEGSGSFRANENAHPFTGNINELHFEKETRIETIYPVYKENEVISALLEVHPYEEVAYDIYPLSNEFSKAGSGIIGELEKETSEEDFLSNLKEVLSIKHIRHSQFTFKKLKKIAICSGSGSFLIQEAIRKKAGLFVTADLKYHDFLEADGKILLADIGHYESEQIVKELLFKILTKNFNNFAVLISKMDLNPVYYY